jgi:hypothetical protein
MLPVRQNLTPDTESLLMTIPTPSPTDDVVFGRIIRKRKHHTGIAYAVKPILARTTLNISNVPIETEEDKEGRDAKLKCTENVIDDHHLDNDNNDSNCSSSDVGGEKSLIPPPPVLVLVPKDDPCVAWCFVGAVVFIELQKQTTTGTFEEKDVSQMQEEKKDDEVTGGDIKAMGDLTKHKKTNSNKTNTPHHQRQRQRKHLRDAQQIHLIQCSPDPNAIVSCLEMVLTGVVSLSAFPSSLCFLQDIYQVQTLLALPPKDEERRKHILDISRALQVVGDTKEYHYQYHHPDAKKYGTSRARPPKIKRRFWFVLEQMEKTIPRIQPYQTDASAAMSQTLSPNLNVQALEDHLATDDNDIGEEGLSVLVNVPDVLAMSNKHQITRMDYMKIKKWPQVRWLLQKLQHILDHHSSSIVYTATNTASPPIVRILDVGGGRGDLAVAMAQSFANVHVTIVDVNETSLQAGKDFAEQVMGKVLADRQTSWYCDDFAHFVVSSDQSFNTNNNTNNNKDINFKTEFDVVVAWHACGDLSDYALEYATRMHASFIICPCCYTKRYIDGFQAQWIGDYTLGKEFDITDLQHQQQQHQYCQEVASHSFLHHQHGDDNTPTTATSPPAPRPYTETLATDIVAVQRMAEINEHVEVSQRAMLLINSMRLTSLMGNQRRQQQQLVDHEMGKVAVMNGRPLRLSLEQYDIKHSSKNLVLVGLRQYE